MFWRVLCIFVLLTSLLGNALSVQAEIPSFEHLQAIKNPSPKIKIIEPTRVDRSQPLEKLAAYKINTPAERRTIPLGMLTRDTSNALGLAPQADQAVQNTRVTGQMPPTVINFDGIGNSYSVAPPDTNGDIGPNHYVQWVNLGLQIWRIDRAAGTAAPVLGPLDGNTLWAGYGGPCENDNDGDPVVLYDALADRWFLSQFAVTGGYYQCVAVSVTPDPTGAYYRYAYNWGDKMNDYPKFGVWPDGYYMTANQFSGNIWGGAGVGVLERQKMLLGLKARLIQVDLYDANRNFGGILPADLDGNPPPAGTPGYFIEVDDSSYGLGSVDEMRIWEAVVNWDAAPPTMTFGQGDNFGQPSAVLPVNNFSIICQNTRNCVPQAGSTQSLDAIGDRLMFRLAYRYFAGEQPYEALVVNHTVLVDGRAGVRWYEVRRTAGNYSIHQQSTYAGDDPGTDTDYRWMGSIAMDWQGNMALGYSMSSAARHPSIAYTGRLATDPLNTLPQGEYIAHSGSASQSEINRWGDYSSMSVDPVDECTFWYTQEYTRGGWDWATRIMAFKMPTCPPQPGGILRGNVSSAGSPVEGALISAGAYSTTSGADGSYSFPRLPAGTYTVTVKASGYAPAAVSSVVVTNGATTTQNFELTSLDTVTVTVQLVDGDGHTGMPLYGWIDITSSETKESRIYTDPVTGQATAELFQDVLYSLTAQVEKYQPASRSVTYTTPTAIETFALQTSALLGCPPGYERTEVISEGFESGQVPPPGWYEYQLGDASDGFTTSPTAYQGAYSAFHDDYRVASESFDALVMPVQNLPANSALEFFERENYASFYDYHGVWVTTGSSPSPLVSTYVELAELKPGSNGVWQRRQVDLSAYAGMNIFIAFYYKGNFSDEWNIDQVQVIEKECQVIAGGRVTGFVTDALNGNPLVGAKIESPSGTATSIATPEDKNIPDGFYNIWAPPGAAAIRAGSAKYRTTTTNITISENTAHRQDFALSAGKVSVEPNVISTSVVLSNTPITMDLFISNVGAVDMNYQVKEYYQKIAPVFQTLPSGPFAPNHRHVGPKNLNLPSLKDVVSYMAPVPAPMSADKPATSWDSDLGFPWGIGFNTTAGNLWLGNVLAGGGDNKNYRFTTAGVNTGDTIDTSSWVGIFGADMTFNPYTGMFWQVNVGGDNCIYELDPQAKIPTGRKICPAFGTSERGLAYDPITGTFYAGSWNDGVINHFDSSGIILDSIDIGLNIAGLAFNPSTGHLFVSENDADATDIFVLDTSDNYDFVDAFNITGLNGDKQGIELDCQGQLWVVSTPYVFKTQPIESGVCTSLEIPWLSISPSTGQAAADTTKTHQVTFNPAGLIPGEYTGYVGIFADTPYAPQVVEFHLTVTYVGRAYFPIIGR